MSPSTTPARRTSKTCSEAAAPAAPQTPTRRGDCNEPQKSVPDTVFVKHQLVTRDVHLLYPLDESPCA